MDTLLDLKQAEIILMMDDEEENNACCNELIEKWTPQLENETLEAFIKYYYDEMYENWGPDDPEESKEYWPEFNSPEELIEYIGTDVTLCGLEDAIYAQSKTGDTPYESQNVPVCVVLSLNCPWNEDDGWAAVFVEGKLVKVDSDIVDCVYLD